MKAFLDTHAAVMLWSGDDLGPSSEDLLEHSAIFVSPAVRLELGFLREIGRLEVSADEILGVLMTELGVVMSDDPMQDVVAKAMDLHWTRDPFDRLLVATAVRHNAPFVTRDQKILQHFGQAVW
jgi:PIN domain nuclease of toxin-antitoxin system